MSPIHLLTRLSGPIVLFGDSTTALRPNTITYGALLEGALRKSGSQAQVINAGVPGNTTQDGRERMDSDVLACKPSLVVIQFGINDSTVDVWKSPPATGPRVSLEAFQTHIEYFVESVRSRDGTVVVMTPNRLRWTPRLVEMYGFPPYRPEDENGLNVMLDRYAEVIRNVSSLLGVRMVDIHAAYASLEGEAIDALLLDGMHPNDSGHRLVYELLISEIQRICEASVREGGEV